MNSKEKGLLIACKKGNEKKIIEILEKGVNVNAKDTYGETALMYASKRGNINIVKILLKYNADVNEVTHDKKTALMYACESNNMDALKRLIIANKKEVGLKGVSKLLASYKKGNQEIIDILLNNGANIDAVDRKGRSALIKAVNNGNLDIISYLIKKGANLNVIDKDKKTALMYAVDSENVRIIKKLIKEQAYARYTNMSYVGINIRNLETAKKDVEYIKKSDWYNRQRRLKIELEEDIATIKLLRHEEKDTQQSILTNMARRRNIKISDDILSQKNEILLVSRKKLKDLKELFTMVNNLKSRANLGIEKSIVSIAFLNQEQRGLNR